MRCAVFLLNGVCDKKTNRNQRTEIRRQKTENGCQKSDIRNQNTENRYQKTENRKQISDIEAVGCHLPESK